MADVQHNFSYIVIYGHNSDKSQKVDSSPEHNSN